MKNTANRDRLNRLIFALDIEGDLSRVLSWVDLLRDKIEIFKVGKELFTRFGPEIVWKIQERGAKVFLDLKYHDIPHTVSRAVASALSLGVFMLNIHALGGRKMIKEAVAAVEYSKQARGGTKPLVLAVTVLTSLNDDDIRELGFSLATDQLTSILARLAQEAGASGVVASPRDIRSIRQICGEDFVIVTPGIRGAGKITDDDQKRVMSAEEAIGLGADYLVVGRPIAEASDPVAKAEEFLQAITRGQRAVFSQT